MGLKNTGEVQPFEDDRIERDFFVYASRVAWCGELQSEKPVWVVAVVCMIPILLERQVRPRSAGTVWWWVAGKCFSIVDCPTRGASEGYRCLRPATETQRKGNATSCQTVKVRMGIGECVSFTRNTRLIFWSAGPLISSAWASAVLWTSLCYELRQSLRLLRRGWPKQLLEYLVRTGQSQVVWLG